MKQHAADAVNGSFAGSLIVATVAGWSIQEWAAAAALFYSVLLILDKLGLLSLIRNLLARVARWVWSFVSPTKATNDDVER